MAFPTPQKERYTYFLIYEIMAEEFLKLRPMEYITLRLYRYEISSLIVVYVNLSLSALTFRAAFLTAHLTVIPSFLLSAKGSVHSGTASKDLTDNVARRRRATKDAL